jgi:uncharacterized protein YigE (DUF2233 family)
VSTSWETLAPGLERRTYIPANNTLGQLIVLRINPTYFTFRVHYRPGDPLTLDQWQEQIPSAAAFVNANFFNADHRIIGLLIADGVVYGESFTDRGGTFLFQNGVPRVRSNVTEPYRGEAIEQAVQAFPMLVQNGVSAFTSAQPDRVNRRTVVAQDGNGHILLMVTPMLGLTLVDLSAYLPTTDMNIVHAFNLDGGGSSLMYHQSNDVPATVVSFDPVPAILAVYAR